MQLSIQNGSSNEQYANEGRREQNENLTVHGGDCMVYVTIFCGCFNITTESSIIIHGMATSLNNNLKMLSAYNPLEQVNMLR